VANAKQLYQFVYGIIVYMGTIIAVDMGGTHLRDSNLSAKQVAEAALNGDALSIVAYQRAGEYLGIGVASFLRSFDPSIIVFGSGVSQVGSLLFDSFNASLKRRVFHPRYLEHLEIEMAALGARTLAEQSLQSIKSTI
jgi:predicted NBD/HSP70 family sugar kinase